MEEILGMIIVLVVIFGGMAFLLRNRVNLFGWLRCQGAKKKKEYYSTPDFYKIRLRREIEDNLAIIDFINNAQKKGGDE